MDAFEKVLFYQNKNFNHSWFIMFDKSFKGQILTWFLKWWEMFGLVPQIFSKALQDVLRYFNSRFRTDTHNSQFPTILRMTTRYKIHCISMWSYAIGNNLLNKEFSVKQWDSLKIDLIISQINKDFPPPIQRTIAQKSRSQSNLDSIPIAGKSSKEIKDLTSCSSRLHSQRKKKRFLLPRQKHPPATIHLILSKTHKTLTKDIIWIVPRLFQIAPVTIQNSTSKQATIHEQHQSLFMNSSSTLATATRQKTEHYS